MERISLFFPSLVLSETHHENILNFINKSYEANDLNYTYAHAMEWATEEDGSPFTFPAEAINIDAADFVAHQGNLELLIKSRQEALLPDRINHQRLDAWPQDDPDLPFLRIIADGIPMVVDEVFKPNLHPQISHKSRILEPALCKHHFKYVEAGIALAIPTQLLMDYADINQTNLSFNPISLALQHDKPECRPTSNYSYDNLMGSLLNTPRVKEAMKQTYGAIHNMQLEDIMAKILALEQEVQMAGLVLWKIDLKGAFNLLFFEAKRAGLFAMTLNQFITIISLVGNFGWTGTPFAFAVVSRSLLFAIRKRISGLVDICTDDLCGVCLAEDLEATLEIVREIIKSLLGPNSINEKKTYSGRRATMVGWDIDLDTQLVTMAEHNLLRTFYDFLQVKLGGYVTVKYLQRLASYSSRYSTICRYMKPFSQYLYAESSGYKKENVRVLVTEELMVVIDLWTMMLVLTIIEPTRFQRSIASFAQVEPSTLINFDASLTGLGLIFYRIVSDFDSSGNRRIVSHQVFAVMQYSTPYRLNKESKFQNTMEFISIVVDMSTLVSLGFRDLSLSLLGDSINALTWSFKEKFSSIYAKKAAILYMQLMSHQEVKLVVSETLYINTLHNVNCDKMSRGASPLSLGYPQSIILDITSNPALQRWVDKMDPSKVFDLIHLHDLWSGSDSLLQVLLQSNGGWYPI